MFWNIFRKIGSYRGIPPEGSKIKITWLPYNNGWPEKNVYIGSEGIAKECSPEGFTLDMEKANLIVGGTKCRWIFI